MVFRPNSPTSPNSGGALEKKQTLRISKFEDEIKKEDLDREETRAEKILNQNYFKLRCIIIKENCSDLFKNALL